MQINTKGDHFYPIIKQLCYDSLFQDKNAPIQRAQEVLEWWSEHENTQPTYGKFGAESSKLLNIFWKNLCSGSMLSPMLYRHTLWGIFL